MQLILSDKGQLYRKRWNPRSRKYTKIKIANEKNNPLAYLGFAIELEKGFTLRSVFQLIEKYPLLHLIDNYFPAFIEEYKKCPKSGCTSTFVALLVQKLVIYELGDSHVRVDVTAEGEADKYGNTHYSLSFCGLDKLLDLPVRLEKLMISEEQDKFLKKTKTAVMRKAGKGSARYRTAAYPTTYSLWDLLHSIIFELSFHGIPAERDKESEKLTKLIEDVESGKVKTVPFSEIKKRIKIRNLK